jgi:pilus assembly protein Flp/PilA
MISFLLTLRGSSPPGRLKRFGKDEKGATAVEFGFIAFPFFFMLMMIVETTMVFWTRQVLQEATFQASRALLTGRGATLYAGTPAQAADAFRNAVCAQMRMAADCATRLHIDVQPMVNFPGAVNSMVSGGAIDPTQFQMRPVQPSQIVVVRTAYRIPVITSGFFGSLSRLSGGPNSGDNVLESVVAFRTEPFAT